MVESSPAAAVRFGAVVSRGVINEASLTECVIGSDISVIVGTFSAGFTSCKKSTSQYDGKTISSSSGSQFSSSERLLDGVEV